MALKRITLSNSNVNHLTSNLLTSGEETIPRDIVSSAAVTATAGTVRLSYFTSRKGGASTQARVATGGTAAGATPTLVKFGLYSIDSSGNGTLVASTASDTTLFAATTTRYTKSWASPYTLITGQRYAFAIIVVSGAAAPTLLGNAAMNNSEWSEDPRLAGQIAAQTDLPASFVPGSVSSSGARIYAVVLP